MVSLSSTSGRTNRSKVPARGTSTRTGSTPATRRCRLVTDVRAVAQALEGDRGMDLVARQSLPGVMVVRIDALPLIDGEARMPPERSR
ncbi:MAG: hypothetical protein LAP85_20060 [Acidobacteriia bacterium]|nr:hypothetical protein [Terriglobia bacterium]